ncbi:MAG: hypothetical protein GF411_10955 [Candidatus Lokiarchaeota archaeon]|nr:hypothetical protein [Candidatus Lokiarchaeota archaeon]
MKINEMIERFRNFSSSFSSFSFCEENRISFSLYEGSWVRIILSRCLADNSPILVEVEVALPTDTQSTVGDTEQTLTTMIDHLNYLLQLYRNGFTLEVLVNEGIWMGTLEFHVEPSIEIFKLLIPPVDRILYL